MKKDIINKKFKVLDKGFVRLVDYMGDDSAIVQAARVSYGKGTKTRHEDEGLIRYLMRHRHTTPFEQCQLKFHVKVPMDTWRQWVRHRTASINEYSTRYSEAIDDKQETKPNEWRLQDTKKNLQGSSGYLPESDNLPSGHEFGSGKKLTLEEENLHKLAGRVYQDRLNLGVAREQARKDLPLSTYTMAYWAINLHNLLHFLELRMDSHAQLEIRKYANKIGYDIVSELFPITWNAFVEYRLKSVTLTNRDIFMLKRLDNVKSAFISDGYEGVKNILADYNGYGWFKFREDGTLKNNLERLEFEEKAKKLGYDVPWEIGKTI